MDTAVKGLKVGRLGGGVGNLRRRIERVATGGNAQERAGEETVGALGEIITAGVCGREPTGGDRMGNNGPHPKREGELMGYWTC